MSWMKRRGQPSPNPTKPGLPIYNPNEHSNTEQPYQQWPQQTSQQFSNDWYGQQKGPSKTPPSSQYSSNTNYWHQSSYNQPTQNFNTSTGHQNMSNIVPQHVNQYQQYKSQYPTNYQQNYYQNPNSYSTDTFNQQQSYAQTQQSHNFYQQQPQQQQQQQQLPPMNMQQQNQPDDYGNQGIVNQVPTQNTDADPWNWESWDDNTNANSQPIPNDNVVQQNNVTDSFANDESWNWSIEENNGFQSEMKTTPNINEDNNSSMPQNFQPIVEQPTIPDHDTEPSINLNENTETNNSGSDFYQNQQQHVDTLEELPTLPNLRRLKNENLTPQWSIESQVSQDSSEDVLLTSESDNRSNILSQSSTTSHSPTRQHDSTSDFNIPPPTQISYRYDSELNQITQSNVLQNIENTQSIIQEESINSKYYQDNNTIDYVDKAMEELNLNAQFENKEIVSPEDNVNSINNKEVDMKDATTSHSVSTCKKIITPPLVHPPPMATGSNASVDLNKNPYKKSSGMFHKVKPIIQNQNADIPPSQQQQQPPMFLQQNPQSAFTQIRPISPISGNVSANTDNNMGVNLETLPDNSERPDLENIPKHIGGDNQKNIRKINTNNNSNNNNNNIQQQWAENCEVAPINDRNQYLETGQLSDADIPVYNQSGNDYQIENVQSTSNDSLPPPGLRRLVLGQIEQSDVVQPNDTPLDAPPPGLSRKVIGSTAPNLKMSKVVVPHSRNIVTTPTVFQSTNYQNNEEPPAGLHRMIPGESSSPETSTYNFQPEANVFQTSNYDDGDNYVSESELNQMGGNVVSQRSATIGADTPPVTNQQTISNTGYSSSPSVDPVSPIPSREGAVGIDNDQKENPDHVANNQSEESNSATLPPDNSRREDIDGGTEDEISSTVRNQTVGKNTTDDLNVSSGPMSEKHRNRNYATDSDHEQSKELHRSSSPGSRYEKDRRYYDDRRDRRRDRDSPDRYRNDRKYEKRHHQKDRRYEDDTDYYSDKERSERRHRDDRSDYDKRYNSLRREKDRRRERNERDRRDYDRDDRRSDYYYGGRYEDDYYNRSRPSSRTDSMHDSYRERSMRDREHDRSLRSRNERDRERDPQRRARDHRDPYNPTNYYSGYNYDPFHPYYQQYQYYEHLRRTNPEAYAEIYRKYYQSQPISARTAYTTEDRASVHSGRSSANDERSTDRLLDITDSSMQFEDQNASSTHRMTPTKFSTAHVKAVLAAGSVVKILPHYPVDGQPATVELIDMQSLLFDDETRKELDEYPGPLTKGTTHKKTIIDYCENKIKKAISNYNIYDVQSYILMWELLILLLRQNGVVVGTDIAELLMKNKSYDSNNSRQQSLSSCSSTQQLDTAQEHTDHANRVSPALLCKEEYITDKFREYLIYGSGKEALEWAMKHGLWGHALFLASKLDKRTYANVMMRFANGLPINDPLQTLYQLLSGRQPAAVTCVAEEKWGDWRPHLAMILSNTSQRPDLDRKAITTLGDTLLQRGNLYAAHFCYLMAQIEFGRYGCQNAKLVLLSSSHLKPFNEFATNEAIFMTEIYEYACSLSDPSFHIAEFQSYKYLLATRLVDYGLTEKALLYLERVSESIRQDPSKVQLDFVSKVCELADRLKFCDPMQNDTDADSAKNDLSWLSDIKKVLNDYNMGLIQHESLTTQHTTELEQQIPSQYDLQLNELPENPQIESYPQQHLHQQSVVTQDTWPQVEQPETKSMEHMINQTYSNYENNGMPQTTPGNYPTPWHQPVQEQIERPWNENIQQNPNLNTPPPTWNTQTEEPPQISIPNQSKSQKMFESDEEFDSQRLKTSSAAKSKPTPAPDQSKSTSTGWFGGIWSKLALRPKNQMRLPDDKNPTIVWDSEKKRWVNLEEDNNDTAADIKPPPKMSELLNKTSSIGNNSTFQPSSSTQAPNLIGPTSNEPSTSILGQSSFESNNCDDKKPPSGANMFKLQRTKNIKKAYVDVFNPNGAKSTNPNYMVDSNQFTPFPTSQTAVNKINFFVPQPTSDPNAPTDFLTPRAKTTRQDDNVQSDDGGAPMMYNPNQFSNVSQIGNYPMH